MDSASLHHFDNSLENGSYLTRVTRSWRGITPLLKRTKTTHRLRGMNKDTEERLPTNLMMYLSHLKQFFLSDFKAGRPDRIPTVKCSHFSYSIRLSGRWLSDSAVASKQARPCNLANALTLLATLQDTAVGSASVPATRLCADFLPRLFFGMDNNQGRKLQ